MTNADKKTIFLYYWHMQHIRELEPETEYRFGAMAAGGMGKGVKLRLERFHLQDWRFDYAFPKLKVAVEVEGGVFSGGRHSRGAGYTEDLKKYNTATSLGWFVFRFTPDLLQDEPDLCIGQVLRGLSIHEETLKKLEVTKCQS
jgi:very-short-patch-repair endonuclease